MRMSDSIFKGTEVGVKSLAHALVAALSLSSEGGPTAQDLGII